jgi:hypothetical protein
MSRSKRKPAVKRPQRVRLCTLSVFLTTEPQAAAGTVPSCVASRTLQMRGDQTLEDLHQAIAAAFERPGDYSYEFQFEAGDLHPEGRRYVVPGEFDLDVAAGTPAVGRVTETTLDSLGLEPGLAFAYWPDAGDDWWHPIQVERVAVGVPRGKYPRVLGRSGDSPFRGRVGDPGDGGPRTIGREEGADTACLVAEMHLSKGEYRKAIEAFSRALAVQPTVDAYQGRARAYRALAEADERAARRLRRQR